MQQNVGNLDRYLRYLLSGVLLVSALLLISIKPLMIFMAFVGGLLFCSATSRVCPVYVPFKITTCSKASE